MSEENLTEQLVNNPIYAMSLSSKELFHSNFWAWLIERNIEYAKVFFPDDLKLETLKNVEIVEREQNHRDVTVWQKRIPPKRKDSAEKYDQAFVIENKFKSIPTKEQLLRYQEALEAPKNKKGKIKENEVKEFCRGLLTGLEKPGFMGNSELEKWSFLSYEEIGKGIIGVANKPEVEKDGFEKEIIIEYGKMIINLQELLLGKLKETGKQWKTYDKNCDDLRINDIFAKLVSSRFERFLNDKLIIDTNIGVYKLCVNSYYGQNGAGVDIRYVIPDDILYTDVNRTNVNNAYKGKICVLGVQIEADQYRWCVQKAEYMDKYSSLTDIFFEEFHIGGKNCKYDWFVDYNHKDFASGQKKTIIDHVTKETRMTAMGPLNGVEKPYPYRLYTLDGKGAYTFMYQYWLLKKDGDKLYSFEELAEHIKRDMEKAAEILKLSILSN